VVALEDAVTVKAGDGVVEPGCRVRTIALSSATSVSSLLIRSCISLALCPVSCAHVDGHLNNDRAESIKTTPTSFSGRGLRCLLWMDVMLTFVPPVDHGFFDGTAHLFTAPKLRRELL
jgi:hypothetical protein